jgi:hypothetical protein
MSWRKGTLVKRWLCKYIAAKISRGFGLFGALESSFGGSFQGIWLPSFVPISRASGAVGRFFPIFCRKMGPFCANVKFASLIISIF